MLCPPKLCIPAETPVILYEVITENLDERRKSFHPERRLMVDTYRFDPIFCTVVIFWEGVPMHVLQAKRADIKVLS